MTETMGTASQTGPLSPGVEAGTHAGLHEDSRRVALPLCIDLDGTLIRSDSLLEAMVSVVLSDMRNIVRIPVWLFEGKAALKAELADRWQFDPALLPYNQGLLDYIRAEYAAGRHVVLCTATHRRVADAVAAHLGCFSRLRKFITCGRIASVSG